MPRLQEHHPAKMFQFRERPTAGRSEGDPDNSLRTLGIAGAVPFLLRAAADPVFKRDPGSPGEAFQHPAAIVVPGGLIIAKYFETYIQLSGGQLVQLALSLVQAQNIMSRRNHEQIQDSSQEAEEVHEQLELEVPPADPSDEDGEDLLDQPERDYQAIEKLDRYEDEGVDHQSHDLNPEAKKAAEKQLARRDAMQAEEDLEVEEYMEDEEEKVVRYRQLEYYSMDDDYDEAQDHHYIDAEEKKGRFDSWLNLESVRRYIRHHFFKFITRYGEKDQLIYFPLVKQMVLENKQSLILDFVQLRTVNQTFAQWVAYHPISFIPELNAALFAIVCKLFPNYKSVGECYVRILNLPVVDKIRQLSHQHLGKMIKIQGLVTTRSEVYNQLIKIVYKCIQCGFQKGPFHIQKGQRLDLGKCHSCQSNGPYVPARTKSIYRNYQTINIQESPAFVPPGRIPRCKEAIVFGDIIDTVKPGDEVEIVGVFLPRYECSLNVKQGFPVFSTYIETNSIKLCDEVTEFASIDEERFEKFPKTSDFENSFYNSIAPSIYGHKRVKKSLTMAMFGGVRKEKNHHRIRGDINVLLLGDPGIAKSQFLKSIQKVFPRCIYTTGKGASAVGLTACVKQDTKTNEWKLEAGALVLADKGICLIDEFDKMSEADRTSIHEAMEQQTISISKAGIVANLNARCSVIAAANPFGGRYNESLSFNENVNLTDPILSRFDIINVLKDKCNEQLDGKLSKFVINEHMRSHPYAQGYAETDMEKEEEEDYEQRLLEVSLEFIKQYIRYARTKYHPTFTNKSAETIQKFYEKLRKYSKDGGGINIVPRHLQSMVRICQAHARMHLRQETTLADAQFAISMMLQTFIETQKHSIAEKIRKNFSNYLDPKRT